MQREKTAEKTKIIFEKIFGRLPDFGDQTSADDIDKWDSLNHVILIQELEKEFGMNFDLFEIIEIRDVGGIIDYIHSKAEA